MSLPYALSQEAAGQLLPPNGSVNPKEDASSGKGAPTRERDKGPPGCRGRRSQVTAATQAEAAPNAVWPRRFPERVEMRAFLIGLHGGES